MSDCVFYHLLLCLSDLLSCLYYVWICLYTTLLGAGQWNGQASKLSSYIKNSLTRIILLFFFFFLFGGEDFRWIWWAKPPSPMSDSEYDESGLLNNIFSSIFRLPILWTPDGSVIKANETPVHEIVSLLHNQGSVVVSRFIMYREFKANDFSPIEELSMLLVIICKLAAAYL